MDGRFVRLLQVYHEMSDHYRGALLDTHTSYHDGPFDSCQRHRCYEYRWLLQQHGTIPRPEGLRQR
jgi:hypothetical protein